MRTRLNRRFFALLAISAAAGFVACDSPLDPDDSHGDPAEVELYDRATGELLANTHGDHWDGGLPHLEIGETIEVDVVFLDEDGDEVPVEDDFTVRALFADGAADDVVEIGDHDDYVEITALADGSTELVFALWHGTHPDWESDPLTVLVGDVEQAGEPVAVQLFERGTEELITETHGTGEEIEWEDDFPELEAGSGIEVDVVFLNSAGEPIELGGDHTVQARLDEGASEGVVSLESHGDHVDIEALEAGETSVVFAFHHEEEEEWAPPAIAITVVDP